jgi:hypothetical protein
LSVWSASISERTRTVERTEVSDTGRRASMWKVQSVASSLKRLRRKVASMCAYLSRPTLICSMASMSPDRR